MAIVNYSHVWLRSTDLRFHAARIAASDWSKSAALPLACQRTDASFISDLGRRIQLLLLNITCCEVTNCSVTL